MNSHTTRYPALGTPGSIKLQNRSVNREYYNVNSIRETAYGHWPEILESLGINRIYLKNKHGACPICHMGKDRFRFDDQKKGTFFCNKCGSGDGFKLLQLYHGWNFSETLKNVAKLFGCPRDQAPCIPTAPFHSIEKINSSPQLSNDEICTRRNRLNQAWQATRSIVTGDPVDCYLRARRISYDIFPVILRLHPHLPYYNDDRGLVGHFPAMLAMVQDPNNHGITIHRTYLGDGCKASVPKPKKLMSPVIPGSTQGAAIKLYDPTDGKLALAEGIETALAFNMATNIPTWATVSAGGMETVILPSSATDITIAVDNDVSGRGQKAAYILSQRLLSEGRKVKRVIPPKIGSDFADMLMEDSQ